MKKKGVKDKEEVLLKLEVSLDLVSLSVTSTFLSSVVSVSCVERLMFKKNCNVHSV